MKRGSKDRGPKKKPSVPAAPIAAAAPYAVEFSETAFAAYESLYRKMQEAEGRADAHSAHHTVFRMIEEVIKVFIPRNPINKDYGLSAPLSQFFRIKKGRYRICWAASSQQRKVCILFISETLRKQGDANDPYEIFQKLVDSGKLDSALERLKK
ncbi:MAG TPA: type II toxin-antitoxin system YhaV family toxin [Candidatus Acidoferrales bacterium]